MKVVMSGAPPDQGPIRSHIRTKQQRQRLAERFKNPEDDFGIAIVVEMCLTGFDVPCAHKLYLDKPLAGHSLTQAIALVNRVYGEKSGGLIVDSLGLADQFADALATYAQASGQDEAAFKQVQEETVPAMLAFEKLRSFFHGFNYEAPLDAPQSVLSLYASAADYVLAQGGDNGDPNRGGSVSLPENSGRRRLRKLVKELAAAFALAVPRAEKDLIVAHLAFFQHLLAMIQSGWQMRPGINRDSSARLGCCSAASDWWRHRRRRSHRPICRRWAGLCTTGHPVGEVPRTRVGA